MSDLGKPAQSTQGRVIRVFISSTFRDMHAEREELVKRIFPQLRKLCESRGVIWGEVDLRWGIPDEQKAEGKVLPICLAEIHRCRPYFIALLGERYGWVPEEIPAELIELEPWLAEHRHRSVTELEILHGVLNNPAMADHAFFYTRSPSFIESLPAEEQAAHRELPTPEEIERHGPEEAERRAEERRRKLATLKEGIRTSGFPLRENYSHPQHLGQLVLQDLTAVIKRLFPEETIPDPLTQEGAEHEAFARTRTRVYIGRSEYFARLDAHAQGDGPPLVVLGESGVGKSALLANWVLRYRDAHPEDLVIPHFIGATPYSADWARLVRRLLGECQRRFGIEKDLPVKPEDLKKALDEWLPYVAAAGRVVLVLDGLNQLEDKDNAPDLLWLPVAIPPRVRVVVSTLPGRPLEALKRRGWPTLTIEPFTEEERGRFIEAYLAQYTKALAPRLAARITAASQAANPLYLQALLEELRVFGAHERLEGTIAHYLEAQTIPDLYARILTRYEADYGRERPGLVRDAFSLIWAARRGLSEAELLDLLGTNGVALPRALWSPLYLAAESALGHQAGRLSFFHPHIRQAVEDRYLPRPERQQAAHLKLADYFAARERDDRVLEELPWQLEYAEQWERLKDLLADIATFLRLKGRDEYELLGYWLTIGERWDMVVEYHESVARWEQDTEDSSARAHALNELASFLRDAGRFAGAEPLYRRSLAICERVLGPEHPDTAASLGNLAALLKAKGDYAGAEPLYRRSLAIWERVLGPEHPDTMQSMSNLAQMLREKGEYGESANLYRRILIVGEQIIGRSGAPPPSLLSRMAISHNELASHTHVPAKDWDQAASHYQRSLELFEQLREPVEVANVGLNLQTLYRLSGRPVDVSRVRDLTRILEEAGDRRAEKGRKLLAAFS